MDCANCRADLGDATAREAFICVDVAGDEYIYSYTPGPDVDNYFPAEDTDFGNDNVSTGILGGVTGFYNVYITWPNTSNAGGTCTITITNDGEDVVGTDVNMNGNDSNGNNRWLLIAEGIEMTAGVTYTVSQVTDNPGAGVSMRSHGVMW